MRKTFAAASVGVSIPQEIHSGFNAITDLSTLLSIAFESESMQVWGQSMATVFVVVAI